MSRRVERMMGFGGPWTTEKLNILESYLNSYTTALKSQPFRLVYVDAFAGSGEINIGEYGVSDFDSDSFVTGSTARALRARDRPFDQFAFVEKQADSYNELMELKAQHPDRLIDVKQGDANALLASLSKRSFRRGPTTHAHVDWRGVLFVDPFGTELKWTTVGHIAALRRLDMWLLVPVGAIGRMLPLSRNPDEVQPKWVDRLNIVFGGNHWRKLYSVSPQGDLFGQEASEREPGVDGLLKIYKDQLKGVFGARFLPESRTLKNSKNSPLFEFIFCAGHPKGARIAKKIAKHLIERM